MKKVFAFIFVFLGFIFAQEPCEEFCKICTNEPSENCVDLENECNCFNEKIDNLDSSDNLQKIAAEREADSLFQVRQEIERLADSIFFARKEAARIADSIYQYELFKADSLKNVFTEMVGDFCKTLPCKFQVEIKKENSTSIKISEIPPQKTPIKTVAHPEIKNDDSQINLKPKETKTVSDTVKNVAENSKESNNKTAPKETFDFFTKSTYASFGMFKNHDGIVAGYHVKTGTLGYTGRFMFNEFLGLELGFGFSFDYTQGAKDFIYELNEKLYAVNMQNKILGFALEMPLRVKIGGGKYIAFASIEELFRKPIGDLAENQFVVSDVSSGKKFIGKGFDLAKWEFETYVGIGVDIWEFSLQYSLLMASVANKSNSYEVLDLSNGFKLTLSFNM